MHEASGIAGSREVQMYVVLILEAASVFLSL